MKRSFSSYFEDEQRRCSEPFCMQRALMAPGHSCCPAEKAPNHVNIPCAATNSTPDAKLFTQTPESWRPGQLTVAFLKQHAPYLLTTPVRSKASTPRGLAFDSESKDAWSLSMATPQSGQVNTTELDTASASSTSGDESCSSSHDPTVIRVSSDCEGHCRQVGQVISQRLVVRQEVQIDNCHRTPLTLAARKLFSNSDQLPPSEPSATPSSPQLLSPEVLVRSEIIRTRPCSQDLFDDAAPPQSDISPSRILSSTPISSALVDNYYNPAPENTTAHLPCSVAGDKNSFDTSTCKPDSAKQEHVVDIEPDSIPVCKPDSCKVKSPSHIPSKDIPYHNNSDLMDELFNQVTNLTQVVAEQLLKHNQQAYPDVLRASSGCGVSDGVISKDVMVNGFCRSSAIPSHSASCSGTRRRAKPFHAPRLAKEVPKGEQQRSLERLAKLYPSLASSSAAPISNHNGEASDVATSSCKMISCGFTSASGKKFSVSTAALGRAAKLVEDFSGLPSEGCSDCFSVNPQGSDESQRVEEVKGVSDANDESSLKECGQEATDNCGLDSMDNIDMDQFSVFTQLPGYVQTLTNEDGCHLLSTATIKEPTNHHLSITPLLVQKGMSSYITPGGSFNPCPDISATDDELKKMFNTQAVKQFLDFNSSNEDEGNVAPSTENASNQPHTNNSTAVSPTHSESCDDVISTCDSDSHTHNESCDHSGNTGINRLCDPYREPCDHARYSPTHSSSAARPLGLATASGKPVTISTDAMASVKKMWDDKETGEDTTSAKTVTTGLRTAGGAAVYVSDMSLLAVQQLFSDDVQDIDTVSKTDDTSCDASHHVTSCDMSATATTTPVDQPARTFDGSHLSTTNDVVMSKNDSGLQRSCDLTTETTVSVETNLANLTDSAEKIAPIKRKRDPLYTTPEAVLSDRAHPKRMCFTPLVTNSDSIIRSSAVTMTTNKQATKFRTPFKAHQMGGTPQQRAAATPAAPVWRGKWRKLGMSSSAVPFHYSNNTSNKSVNDSGIGSSLPVAEQQSVSTCEEEQFEVTDTQMESFLAATQGSVVDGDDTRLVRPQRGTLSVIRSATKSRTSLASVAGCVRPGRYSRQQLIALGLHPDVVSVTSANAINFQFDVHHYFSQSVLHRGTVTVGDGVVLKLEPRNDHVSLEQLRQSFYNSPGVDSKLISEGWFSNHYRWIVWKLASLEVSFPHSFAGRWLTPHWVLLHMKYRYDREIDLAQRSCIKKILERDDSPAKCMVLVISEVCNKQDDVIIGSGDPTDMKVTDHPTVKVSDGWYSVAVVMDTPLKHILSTNQIGVGCKLYISGAKLLGSCDPCPPLECTDSVMLKITANSTRKAHWNAKLGFQQCSTPFPVSMSSLFPDGGLVGCVLVTVVRSYQLQHMERVSDGSCVFRSQHKEEIVAKECSIRQQQCLEDLSLKVREEFEKELCQGQRQYRRRRRSMSCAQISKLNDGQKIEEALNSVLDPVEFEGCLSATQKALLESYRHSVMEQRRRELDQRMEIAMKEAGDKLPPLRNVVSLLKVRVAGHHPRHDQWTSSVSSCMLTVWRPTDDIISLLQEGTSVKLYHVMASRPHHYSSDSIQLATNRGTHFEKLVDVDDDMISLLYHPRKVTTLTQLGASSNVDYGQVDIVGIVVTTVSSLITTASGAEKPVDKVYIGDEADNIAVVKIWDGVESLVSRDCVSAGHVICFINLSYKSWLTDDGIPSCSTTDLSIITSNPQDGYIKPTFQALHKFTTKTSIVKYLNRLEEQIAYLQ